MEGGGYRTKLATKRANGSGEMVFFTVLVTRVIFTTMKVTSVEESNDKRENVLDNKASDTITGQRSL